MTTRLSIQVFRWHKPNQKLITVDAMLPTHGRRIYGPKMIPGDASLLVEFHLGRNELEQMLALLPKSEGE